MTAEREHKDYNMHHYRKYDPSDAHIPIDTQQNNPFPSKDFFLEYFEHRKPLYVNPLAKAQAKSFIKDYYEQFDVDTEALMSEVAPQFLHAFYWDNYLDEDLTEDRMIRTLQVTVQTWRELRDEDRLYLQINFPLYVDSIIKRGAESVFNEDKLNQVKELFPTFVAYMDTYQDEDE